MAIVYANGDEIFNLDLGIHVLRWDHPIHLAAALVSTIGAALAAVSLWARGRFGRSGETRRVRRLRRQGPDVGRGRSERTFGEERTMGNEQVAPESRGVAVEVLTTVDLGGEIEGMDGRHLRMRMVTIEPGGIFGPIHNHEGRPGTVYVLQGTITDHRNGVATDYGPGVGWPEDRNTNHWLENRGTISAVEISVDIVRQE